VNGSQLNPGFDPRIADFLEADPDRAPDVVLETVLAAFPSIAQRRAARLRWLSGPATRGLAAAAAAVVVLVASAIALWPPATVGPSTSDRPSASPSGAPSTSASASPSITATARPSSSGIPSLTEIVMSRSGDLTIRYPTGWEVRAGDSADAPGALGVQLPADANQLIPAFFSGSSVPLADGQTPEEWVGDQRSDPNQIGCDSADVSIGGRRGVILAGGCGILGGRLHYLAIVVANGRGYSFHMDSRVTAIGDDWFAAFLAGVSFQP
jgi:hypothetical protein